MRGIATKPRMTPIDDSAPEILAVFWAAIKKQALKIRHTVAYRINMSHPERECAACFSLSRLPQTIE
jgi:hypothetical protein